MSISVIIPTRNADNLRVCAGSLQRENARIIVVDDDEQGGVKRICEARKWHRIKGIKPFCFSRNVNLGIAEAGHDDIVILGDDGILKTRGGFDLLSAAATEHPEFGVVAAVTNNVGNLNQRPKGIGLREDPKMVCFICVFIPRRVVDAVGPLDERFAGMRNGQPIYGWEDNDYCRRLREAGYKIGVHDGCFIDHASLKSTFRTMPNVGINAGAEVYREKWGDLN